VNKLFPVACILGAGLLEAADLDLSELTSTRSAMRAVVERYEQDEGNLSRFYDIPSSMVRRERLRQFNNEWLGRLGQLKFDSLSEADRIDYVLFKNHIQHELRQLDIRAKALADIAPLVPFGQTIIDLEEARQRMEPVDTPGAARALSNLRKQIEHSRKELEKVTDVKKTVANRAAANVDSLRAALKTWFTFYDGYDPVFTWWDSKPYKEADLALKDYSAFLLEKLVGIKPGDKEAIVGDPVGREALMSELAYEMIPYTPEQLIEIANKDFVWCENEMKRASREMGYGDDWHKALEHVKTQFVEPGKQPALIRDLNNEAVAFLDKHDLVTVPQLVRDAWRMEMMSPERQLANPFFLGGEVMTVSYPTDTMTEDQKMMTMRGNNIHFARATVFHELIPGHHLQGFMAARYRPYRHLFRTPFSVEGWSLYRELLLWDMKFQPTPEDRVGALFWRMHRCARIIFSLSFHMEKMTPQECIDLLVERVGHERDNAAGEVRRPFSGDYGPLYQCAYLLGGMQLRALHRELVESGKMTNRAFYDAVLRENRISIEMVRASLQHEKLTPDFASTWKFYGAQP
jgi:uncharacterized protein (DUF885 family)